MNASAAIACLCVPARRQADSLLLGVKRHSGVELLVSSFRFQVSSCSFRIAEIPVSNLKPET